MKKVNLKNTNGGFTVIELLISLAIFAVMTALLLSKYGTFNQGVLLKNLAYDVALSIRNAQSYGLNVKSASRNTNDFLLPYGVHFSTNQPTEYAFFVDLDHDYVYDAEDNDTTTIDEKLSKTSITRGSKIDSLCIDSGCTAVNNLDIIFDRPNPNAIIRGNEKISNYAKITVAASDGTKREIEIRSTGQISVK